MGEGRLQPVATSSDAMSGMDSVGTPSKPSRSARAGAGRTFLTPSRGYSCGSRRGPRLLREPRLPRPPCSHLREPPESQRVRESCIRDEPGCRVLRESRRDSDRGLDPFLRMIGDVGQGLSGLQQLSKRSRVCCGVLGGCVDQRLGIGGGWREEARPRLCRPAFGRANRQFRWGCHRHGGQTAYSGRKRQTSSKSQRQLVSKRERGCGYINETNGISSIIYPF